MFLRMLYKTGDQVGPATQSVSEPAVSINPVISAGFASPSVRGVHSLLTGGTTIGEVGVVHFHRQKMFTST